MYLGALCFFLANLPPLYGYSSLLHCFHPPPPGCSESPVVPAFHPMFYIIIIDTITEDPIYKCFIVIILALHLHGIQKTYIERVQILFIFLSHCTCHIPQHAAVTWNIHLNKEMTHILSPQTQKDVWIQS